MDKEAIISSRRGLLEASKVPPERRTLEGGCGVIGIVATNPIPGSSIIRPCGQMRNRGNGKGGGVAATGLFPEHKDHYAIHIAYLDDAVRKELEREYLESCFDISFSSEQPTVDDPRDVGLETQPPTVRRYFVRSKKSDLEKFAQEHDIDDIAAAEDELVYQNSFRLNSEYYAGRENPRAFVLSHGRDLMILKGVGYAEEIARYYRLEETKAHVWIGHQRYPTKGRVWHPGGAHPFAGLHEALVHNGDFANYHSTTEYLRQWGMAPLFVTDTEVSVLLFDLYTRVLGYPLEFVIEALAPTPEGDFERLSKRRQRIYRAIQSAHLQGSPDGPWFFIVARNEPRSGAPQLLGITDVSMLRPQVFALQRSAVGDYAAIASEKQAIDAFFQEVSKEHPEVSSVADRYWNARGGSCTDGGAFSFTVMEKGGAASIEVRDKFGNELSPVTRPTTEAPQVGILEPPPFDASIVRTHGAEATSRGQPAPSHADLEHEGWALSDPASSEERERSLAIALLLADLQRGDLGSFFEGARTTTDGGPTGWRRALDALTFLRDRWWHPGEQRRGALLAAIDDAIVEILDGVPTVDSGEDGRAAVRAELSTAWQGDFGAPVDADSAFVIDARGFEPEGREAVSRVLVKAHDRGFRKLIVYGATGDRFIGCGLGSNTKDVRIDVYGSSGDYLGSGLDGAEIHVHGHAQDQVGQIFKSGRIVVFGNVGQTFLYGAKGGEAFVRGSAAGRPLINAVGRIRTIINGTCLDYCAESFMAGEELDGGFVVINGLTRDDRGEVLGMEVKYPGNNLFSLASGGACYLNDPYQTVTEAQLNGAIFVPFRQKDWNVLLAYLRRNEELFGISIRYDLLMVDGVLKWPKEVFRKVVASPETQGLDWSSLPA